MGAGSGPPFRASVCSTRDLIPYSLEWWETACFELGWMQHGGSGLGRSYAEMLSMPLPHIVRDVERVKARRKSEAENLRRAYKRPAA